jgi:hypothetical protein
MAMFETDGMDYKRKHSRESILIKSEIMVDGDWHDCKILNISTGGAKLQAGKHIGHGIEIFLQIGKFGRISATVAWQNGGELGVKFTRDELEVAELLMGLASYG